MPLCFQQVLKEQKQRRENQVTLYRKYRIGDLPDIQIKYSAVIAPLQALAQVGAPRPFISVRCKTS